MEKGPITLLGVGDIIIDREKPETIFKYVGDVLRSGDIAFANCDQVYSDKGYLIHGHGTHSDPRNIPALHYAGLDVVSLANNHMFDRGAEALLDTMERLKVAGLPYVGAGKNLAEAHLPVILERKGTKIGFLAYSSVHPQESEAKKDSPGVCPIRVWTFYESKPHQQPGGEPQIITVPYIEDLMAMLEDIRKLRSQVDVVVVSFHWGVHFVPRVIPMYCLDVGHAAIDAGADLILGTHTHILKGIEVYKGKVIFYSTSNFASEIGPGALKASEGSSIPRTVLAWFKSPEVRKTLIAKTIIERGKINRVSFIPCFINDQLEPEIVTRNDTRGQEVYDYMKDISKSQGLSVNFSWDGDEVLITP
jgi:poly-gamma-glutamate capsule biosynthesis protein CapA/YwtB (metallophosphatase superfamily)